jgi:hypothetical protein
MNLREITHFAFKSRPQRKFDAAPEAMHQEMGGMDARELEPASKLADGAKHASAFNHGDFAAVYIANAGEARFLEALHNRVHKNQGTGDDPTRAVSDDDAVHVPLRSGRSSRSSSRRICAFLAPSPRHGRWHSRRAEVNERGVVRNRVEPRGLPGPSVHARAVRAEERAQGFKAWQCAQAYPIQVSRLDFAAVGPEPCKRLRPSRKSWKRGPRRHLIDKQEQSNED